MSPSSSVPSSSAAGAAILLSAHRDVLEAPIPNSPQARARLVEELKNRGRSAVSAKAWRDAKLLYEKAIQVVASEEQDEAQQAAAAADLSILYANLSLTLLSMGSLEDARKAAAKSIELNDQYVKGYWRLGQALAKLSRPAEALEAMKQALELDPKNKALQKEVQKLEQQVREEEALMSNMDLDDDVATPVSPPVITPSAAKPKSSSSSKKHTSDVVVNTEEGDDDDALFTQSDHVKGYKVVNGKKTTFFNRELSEQEKQMIGDIAPKRIDSSSTANTSAGAAGSSVPPPQGTSAWNQAGTWEERDVTSWAKETLQTALLATSYTLPESSPAPGAIARVATVSKLDGAAAFATVRGKKRYIYEFLVQVDWEFQDDEHSMTAKGSMAFPDFDGTCEIGEGYEMLNYHVNADTPGQLRPILDRFVKSGGLRDAIHATLDDWVRLFKETY